MTIAQTHRTGLIRSIAMTFAAKVGGVMLGLMASVIVARSLGPEGRGSFASAATLTSIGMQFGNLGLHASNTYYIARDRSQLAAIFANSIVVAVSSGSVAAAVGAVVAMATGMTNQISTGLIGLALLWIPFGLAYILLVNLLLGLHAVARFNQIDIGLRVATLLFTLAALCVQTADATLIFGAGLVAQILALIAVLASLGQRASSMRACSFSLLRQQIPFAFRSYLTSLFAFMLLRSDILLVQHISGNAEAGQYSIAVAMADALYMLPAAAGSLLFPRLSANNNSASRRRETWRMLVQIGLAMSALGLLAVVSAASVIAPLFGPSYLPAVSMFHILVPAIIAYGMNNILSNHMAANGQPWSGVWIWVLALAVNVVFNLAWIPDYGGRGAAYASAVAYSLALVAQTILVFRPRGSTQ